MIHSFYIAFIVKISLLYTSTEGAIQRVSGCSLDISNNTNGASMPLIISSKNSLPELVIPDRGLIKLKKGESVIFACSGIRNKLESVEAKGVESICEGNDELKVNELYLDFEDVKCSKSVHASVTNLFRTCGRRGNLLAIGFSLEELGEWVPLIHVCYDEASGAPLYSYHLLHGEEIRYAPKSPGRPSFSSEGLPSKIRASIAYHRKYQSELFTSLLGSSKKAKDYISGSSYLATGHLSPYADFVYISSQRSSSFYINACPQWQVINNGNWKSVETVVRRTGEMYKRTFKILTGTHDILTLPDKNNTPVEIKLQEGKLPVPKYIWKIMYDEKTSYGIAFIVLNNPFATHYDRPEFCRNVCNIYGWGKSQWTNFKKGYVFCCDIRDLRRIVRDIPNFHVRGVLSGEP